MKLIIGWNKGGVGASLISTILASAGIPHKVHKANVDEYGAEQHIRLVPLSSAELSYFMSTPERPTAFEEMVKACNAIKVIFVPNNVAVSEAEFLISRLKSGSGIAAKDLSISPAILGRTKYNRGIIDISDPELDQFIKYIENILLANASC